MVCQVEERKEAPRMELGCLWRVAMVCQEEERMTLVCLMEVCEVEKLGELLKVQGM